MEHSEYLSYVEQDKKLFSIVEPILPGIGTLNAQQIETLIFYLKSLHTYHPTGDDHIGHYDRYIQKLDALRTSKPQLALQVKASKQLLLAMTLGGVSGIMLALGSLTLFGGNAGWGGLLIAAALGLFVLADARFGKPALMTSKEQDRRYFLECIRAARACNELGWSGLFSYDGITQPGTQSNSDIERTENRVAELSSLLRDSLYNDEYMQYTYPRVSHPDHNEA